MPATVIVTGNVTKLKPPKIVTYPLNGTSKYLNITSVPLHPTISENTTFISKNTLKANRYAAFACQGGSGAEKAFAKLKECLGHDLYRTLILIDPKDKPDPAKDLETEKFCDSL